jgi:transposase
MFFSWFLPVSLEIPRLCATDSSAAPLEILAASLASAAVKPNEARGVVSVGTQRLSGSIRTATALHSARGLADNLIRIWVDKFQAGALDEDIASADLLTTYEARIAALERLVGKQALELEFLKGALQPRPRPRSETTSVIVGPAASALPKGAG